MRAISNVVILLLISLISCEKQETIESNTMSLKKNLIGAWNGFTDSGHTNPVSSLTEFYDNGVELFANDSFSHRYYYVDDMNKLKFGSDKPTGIWYILSPDTLVLVKNESRIYKFLVIDIKTDELVLDRKMDNVYLLRN